ncbi:hypothetical protein L6452_21421 [Arctium lappa]|uniref:Uncharacterized protein n=1 Tax=Arctium lappa TaxID=4217 RepID=A0ACB9AWD6_ARCLA|nr:hypothetical protein L6452_21421 [Arctium lappa]
MERQAPFIHPSMAYLEYSSGIDHGSLDQLRSTRSAVYVALLSSYFTITIHPSSLCYAVYFPPYNIQDAGFIYNLSF